MAQFLRTTTVRTEHGITCKCCRDYGLPEEMTIGHTPMTTPDQTAVASVILAGYKLTQPITGSTRCPVLMTTTCPNRNCFNHGSVRFPTLGHSKSHCPCDWRNAPNPTTLGEHMFPDMVCGSCEQEEGFGNVDAEELAMEQMIEQDEESRMAQSIDEYFKLLMEEEQEELEWQAMMHSHVQIREAPKNVEQVPPPPPVEVVPPPPPVEVVPPPPPVEVVLPPPPVEVIVPQEGCRHFQDSSGAIHIGCPEKITELISTDMKPMVEEAMVEEAMVEEAMVEEEEHVNWGEDVDDEMDYTDVNLFEDQEGVRIALGSMSVEEYDVSEEVVAEIDNHTIHMENSSSNLERVKNEHAFEVAKFEQQKRDSQHVQNSRERKATKKRLKDLSSELELLEKQLDWDRKYGYSPEEDEYDFLRRHAEATGKYSQRCSFIECGKMCVHEMKHGVGACNRLHIPLRPRVV